MEINEMSKVKVEKQIGGTVIHMSGKFIGGEETDLLKRTLNEISEADEKKLVINLADVTYLNSTALGILIASHANFVKREGEIVLCNISKSIENIFVITKLTLVFNIAESLELAIKKFI
jgi:anti-sigma B factor antagonist